MEVVDSYEFKFAEMVNKAGGIGGLMDKLDRQTLYEVEMFIRNRRPWNDDDMAKILDELAYSEYYKFRSKYVFRTDEDKRKELEKHGDNIYFKIHNAVYYSKEIDTDDFVVSLVESKFYRQCFLYVHLGGTKMVEKVDDRLKKDPDAFNDIDVVKYLINKYDDVVYMEKAYQITKSDEDSWRIANKYYRDGDVKKALSMRPCKYSVRIGNLADVDKKVVMDKYPGIDLTVYDSTGRGSIVEIVNPGNAHRACSFAVRDVGI
jgi:hypothetical protein